MKLAIATCALALFAAGNVWADDDPGTGKGKGAAGRGEMLMKLFEKADANGDGKISLEEFKNALENAPKGKLKDKPEAIDKLFKRIDANGDGFITKEEMKKFVDRLADRQGKKKPNKS